MDGDSSLLKAANKSISDLQQAVTDLRVMATVAEAEALKAVRAAKEAKIEAKRWRLLTRVLGVFVLVAIVASSLSVYNWVQQANATNQLRSQAIATCEHNNTERQAEVNVWNRALNNFLALNIQLVISTITPVQELEATKSFVTHTEKYLDTHLAPRNCAAAYSPKVTG